jgi:oligosaccharide repeat unit polymerase
MQRNSQTTGFSGKSGGMSFAILPDRSGPPWWMAPWMLSCLIMLPLLTAALIVPIQFHWELGRMAKLMSFDTWAMAVGGVLSFAAGSWLGAHVRLSAPGLGIEDVALSPTLCRLLRVITWTLFVIAVAAYALWFMPVARDPSILLAVLAGRWHELEVRNTIGTIPGVTTLVQAQIVYVTLLVVRWIYLPQARPSRLEKSALVVVFLLACMRNLIWSERIAVIELLVPAAILFLRQPKYPRMTALAPVFAAVGLVVFFSIFEYFRSWSAYYQYRYDSFAVFIMTRLSGYYITALDNGAGLYRDWGGIAAPLSTADWFWRFPWEIGQTWFSEILGLEKYQHAAWLYWNASPEFNNSSGIFMPFVDYGAIGGMIFWGLFGLLTGQIFRGFAKGGFAGMLIYPSWFIGLLEMPRILYLCEARYFPVLIICLAVIFLIAMMAEQQGKAIARRPVM